MSADSEILTQLTEAVSKLTNNALSTTKIQAVAVNLPEFWTDDPEIWFLRAEAQFRSKSIINDQTKFDYIITALDNRAAAKVKAVLLNPPEQGKYNALKTALLNAFGKSQLYKKTLSSLIFQGLGIRSPPHFYAISSPSTMTPTPFGEHFFVAQLPSQVRAILAAQEFPNLQELALAADRIIEANELLPINSVSALSPRHLKNLQPKHKPKPNPSTHHIICYYHKKFGPNARTCRPVAPLRAYSQWQRHRQSPCRKTGKPAANDRGGRLNQN